MEASNCEFGSVGLTQRVADERKTQDLTHSVPFYYLLISVVNNLFLRYVLYVC